MVLRLVQCVPCVVKARAHTLKQVSGDTTGHVTAWNVNKCVTTLAHVLPVQPGFKMLNLFLHIGARVSFGQCETKS